jgi:hypothetical protein
VFDDLSIAGHELEPAITVNPANPRNIIATWKQDVGPALQSRTDLIASSLDGGKTWTRSAIPGLTACTGGTADAGSDPWLSAGGDGTVYFSGLAADLSTDRPTTAVVASHSRNGGRTWPAPATVAAARVGNEHDVITASPTRAGHAYMGFANFLADVVPRTNSLEFSRTIDGGATWSPPVLIDQPGQSALDFAPRILVMPDGSLLAVFARAVSAFAFEPSIAVDSTGTVGVTWYDLRNDRPGDAALTADFWFAHSGDRGGSWRQTHVAGPTDLRTAPLPSHGFVGEYQGLAGLRGHGFAAVFTMAAPLAKDGPTDIFFARIEPGR